MFPRKVESDSILRTTTEYSTDTSSNCLVRIIIARCSPTINFVIVWMFRVASTQCCSWSHGSVLSLLLDFIANHFFTTFVKVSLILSCDVQNKTARLFQRYSNSKSLYLCKSFIFCILVLDLSFNLYKFV